MKESFNLPEIFNSDYNIIYECQFLNKGSTQANLEFYLADLGEIGFSIDSWSRLYKRLGKENSSKRFVGGHEPLCHSYDSVLLLLNIVSEAEFKVMAYHYPLIGITRTDFFVNSSVINQLAYINKKLISCVRPYEEMGNENLIKLKFEFDKWK